MLLMVHALMRRSERESDLVSEVNRLEDEVARLKVGSRRPMACARSARRRSRRPLRQDARASRLLRPRCRQAPVAHAAGSAQSAAATDAAVGRQAAAHLPRCAGRGHTEREPRLMSHRPGACVRAAAPRSDAFAAVGASPPRSGQPGPTLPDWSAPPAAPAAPGNQMHDYWPARQAKPSLPEGPRVELPPMPSLAAERETDLDAVHGMIKRLADEVNVGAEPTLDGLPPPRQESVLRASLNALQTTANAMRATKKKGGLPVSPAAPRAGAPMPPPIMPSHTRLASLAEAVAAGRIDAVLSPIVGLADHQVHYYEVVACPRDERGTLLSATTRDPQLALAGLLPLLDSARLRQAARVARSFADEGRETCLFAPATAVSLANDSFLDELADAYRDREALAGELVLTFAQADIRTFGGSEWSALTDMRDLGFRFGVEDVTDFDYEFTALCAAGFAFVKLDAATLLAGLAAPNGTMACRRGMPQS